MFNFICDYCGKASSVCNMDERGHRFCSAQCMANYEDKHYDASFRRMINRVAEVCWEVNQKKQENMMNVRAKNNLEIIQILKNRGFYGYMAVS